MPVSSTAAETFGKKLRLRACGLLFRNDKVLLINHSGLYGHDFWAPPGGGVDFGEPVEDALKREFFEECGLQIAVDRFLFGCQFINPPLHAIELFFLVHTSGEPKLGHDPEVFGAPIMTELEFKAVAEVLAFPEGHYHRIFKLAKHPNELRHLQGFFTLPDV